MGALVRTQGTGAAAGSPLPRGLQPPDFLLGRCRAGRPVSSLVRHEVISSCCRIACGGTSFLAPMSRNRPTAFTQRLLRACWASDESSPGSASAFTSAACAAVRFLPSASPPAPASLQAPRPLPPAPPVSQPEPPPQPDSAPRASVVPAEEAAAPRPKMLIPQRARASRSAQLQEPASQLRFSPVDGPPVHVSCDTQRTPPASPPEGSTRLATLVQCRRGVSYISMNEDRLSRPTVSYSSRRYFA